MHSWLGFASTIVAALVFVSLGACGRTTSATNPDAAGVTGTGGTFVGSGGAPGTGGRLATGGASSGSALGSGGVALAGASGTGGAVGMGGATSIAGNTGAGGSLGVGGVAGGGGASVVTGGRSGVGGIVGVGGSVGTGGRTGSGGVTGTGGTNIGTGGTHGTGGGTSSGGILATGGTTGAGGSTTIVTWPAKFVGNIDTRGSIRSDFINYWDQFTPENAGKWGSVQGSSSTTFSWSSLDAMYKYCDEHGIVFKEMSFIWGAGQPGWLGGLDTTTGPAAVKNWMKSFCDRYPKTRIIDVVEEPPPHTTPTYAKVIGGGTNTTWDWIANSFKWAREACPGAVLLMNDYNNIELAGDVQHTIDIVTAIKQLGAPIDAIGCQAHGTKTLTAATLKANIDKLVAGTGLPVYITQYDIGVADDEEQRRLYEDHITMFWNHPDVKGISVWGYIVGATWITNSGIMNSDGTMRPAMSWLMGFLGR